MVFWENMRTDSESYRQGEELFRRGSVHPAAGRTDALCYDVGSTPPQRVFDCYPQEEVSGTVQSISLIGNAKQNATYYDVTLSISTSWQVLPGMNATVWLPAGQ